jgi:hypothetical protein
MPSLPALELTNPRVASRAIRFITPDVALVDGACSYRVDVSNTQTTPLLLVMKKGKEDSWKIASLRLLAQR